MTEILHGGSGWGYQRGCRCDVCTDAHRARIRRRREGRAEELRLDPTLAPHGEVSTYQNWGCRCPECTSAHAANCRSYYRRVTRGRAS